MKLNAQSKIRGLRDFPEYAAKQKKLDDLRAEKSTMEGEREKIAAQIVNARSSDVNTRAQALLDGSGWVNLENLGKQLSECDEALIVYQKAIELGEQELQAILGQVSAELCLERRPEFASEIQKILAALKAIDESNSALERIRDEMEREGISTGSLPWGCFDMGGRWDDQFGGRVVGYQRYVSEFYPECSGNSH